MKIGELTMRVKVSDLLEYSGERLPQIIPHGYLDPNPYLDLNFAGSRLHNKWDKDQRTRPPQVYPQRSTIMEGSKISIEAFEKDAAIFYTIDSDQIPSSFSGIWVKILTEINVNSLIQVKESQ